VNQAQSPLFWQPSENRSTAKIIAAAVAGLVVVGGLAFYLLSGESAEPQTAAKDAPSALPPAPSPAPEPPTPAPAATSARATAASAPPPVEPAEPAPPIAVDPCVASFFPDGTFTGDLPRFNFVCSEADPRKGAIELSGRLIYAGQGKGIVTDAMKEWAILNWYEMAFFALAKARCCEQPKPIHVGAGKKCHFEEALVAVAAARGEELDAALDGYDKAISCVIKFRMLSHFKQRHPTFGPDRDVYKRIAARSPR
jgi:eukaryotic-like serine/threonine-protein kinase